MFEQYKISDMIKALEKQEVEHGDMEILLASEPCGDNLSHVGELVQHHKGEDPVVEQYPFKVHGGKLIIFPINPRPIQTWFDDIK